MFLRPAPVLLVYCPYLWILGGEKKALYAEDHAAQRDMREALAVKTNIDHLLGITAPPRQG